MKEKLPSNLFWLLVLIRFLGRYYLALPAAILLLFAIGSFPCLVISLLLISVNFVLSVSDARILQRQLQGQDAKSVVFRNSRTAQQDNESAPDIIDVEAFDKDPDDNDSGNPYT
ncbi:MAG: hypothetical protein IK130_06400 [Oscillospiraceae bacterium]|nr:hypothetical protein [Oscillospiraceae bacterium]